MATQHTTTEIVSPLEGKWFFSFENQLVNWQGTILAEPAPAIYLVQLFEWVTGAANQQQLARIEDMFGWHFYDNQESLYAAYKNKWGPLSASTKR